YERVGARRVPAPRRTLPPSPTTRFAPPWGGVSPAALRLHRRGRPRGHLEAQGRGLLTQAAFRVGFHLRRVRVYPLLHIVAPILVHPIPEPVQPVRRRRTRPHPAEHRPP